MIVNYQQKSDPHKIEESCLFGEFTAIKSQIIVNFIAEVINFMVKYCSFLNLSFLKFQNLT